MKYYHVDVFTSEPLLGNGLTVVFPEKDLEYNRMLNITREFRQFETIFILPKENGCYPIRIFTVDEELEFAGHPIIGAGAVIHSLEANSKEFLDIKFRCGDRIIPIKSNKKENSFVVTMNQGKPSFIKTVDVEDCSEIISGLNITIQDMYKGYPLEVVSTGLPYLLLPLSISLDKAGIKVQNFEFMLNKMGAKFVYIFNPETMECRTWDNMGLVEDVATGSAAGPLCAYLVKNRYRSTEQKIYINQGRYANRKSSITGWVSKDFNDVYISGEVVFFSHGVIYQSDLDLGL